MLVARDQNHRWVRAVIDEIEPPLFTCEAVLSEACFLVRHLTGGRDAVLGLIARGAVEISFELAPEVERVRKLMQRFASVPMSLADACLVRMAEIDPNSRVLTLDGDFRIYRRNRRQPVALISP
jgi:predicted nucleic acid-binding protein